MPEFIRANPALGGNMSELRDQAIAIHVLDKGAQTTIKVNIDEDGAPTTADALRVQVTDIVTGEDLGVRLLFWAGVKLAVERALDSGYGVIVGVPTFGAHPTQDGFDLWTLEDAVDVSDAQIKAALAA